MDTLAHVSKGEPTVRSKVFEWGKLIAFTGGAQAIVQIVGLITGIVIIRSLSIKEYAFYTIANAMLGTMTLLADSGISSGVMAQGGKVWTDKKLLGTVLATGLDLRKKFAVSSIVLTAPALLYLLIQHGAGILTAIIILLSLVPAFFAALSDSLLEIIPKLHQDIKPLQKNQVVVSLLRLLLTGISAVAFPFTWVAILASGLPRIYGNLKLKNIANHRADPDQPADNVVSKEIFKIVKRTLPATIYYSFSGQITIWMISIFGHAEAIADIGALGRLSMVVSFVGVIFSTLLLPRYARLPNNRTVLLKKFLQIMLLAVISLAIILMMFWASSDLLLQVLGTRYKGLNSQLMLSVAGSCLSLIAGICFTLYTTRGWAIQPFILIPVDFAAIVCGLFLFKVGTINGALCYNIYLSVVLLSINAVYMLYKIATTAPQNTFSASA